jgi:hypothetical protein
MRSVLLSKITDRHGLHGESGRSALEIKSFARPEETAEKRGNAVLSRGEHKTFLCRALRGVRSAAC